MEILPALPDQAGPVADAQQDGPRVDKGELLRGEGPGVFGVCDEELCVWWEGGGLNGREVDAEDLGLGKVGGEGEGPDSGASAYV